MSRLTIDLGKIEENTRLVAELLRPHGVGLTGVTKACLGHPLVGEAMLAGGASSLADSRLENIASLRRKLPEARLELLRSPATGLPARGHEPDLFFVTSAEQAHALASSRYGIVRLCLMIETGDGREGAPVHLAAAEAADIFEMEGAELVGLATNTACAQVLGGSASQPSSLEDTLSLFYESSSRVLWGLGKKGLAARRQAGALVPARFGKLRSFPVMSAGGSGLLKLLIDTPGGEDGKKASFGDASPLGPVTELRCGEAILLGRIPDGGETDVFLPGAHRDAFIMEGEVLEAYEKDGASQALLDFGLQDVGSASLLSCVAGFTPGAATSDYTAVSCDESVRLGDRLSFIPSYYALLAAMTSPFVEKIFRRSRL